MSNPDAQVASTQPRGHVIVEELAPGVIVYRMHGYLEARMVPLFEKPAQEHAVRGHKVELFFDTDSMTGNDPQFRHRMTAWHNAFKPHTRSLSVYVRSKLISMSVS